MDWIRENLNWIKDIFTIIFSGSATIIAILTYARAKETFLQPIRTEVIKQQSIILTNLLEFLHKNDTTIDFNLDYEGIVKLNTFIWLKRYGFILDKEYDFKELDKNYKSLMIAENGSLKNLEIITTFNEERTNLKEEDISRKLYENAKNGKIDIDQIFLTEKYSGYIKELERFVENPLLPSKIKTHLTTIILNIQHNLRVSLIKIIRDFIGEVLKKQEKPLKFSIIGIWNDFNHLRIHHKQKHEHLKQEIRDYLKIDSMP